MDVKKTLVPTIMAVATLVVLVVGATYAYFSVTGTNNFGTKTITASAPTVGSVALSSGTALTMNLTAQQMMKGSSDITYYATASGTSTTASSPVMATAAVTGDGTFSCDYTFNIAASSTGTNMYTAFQGMSTKSTGQIVLTVTPFGGTATTVDFNTASAFPKTISGTVTGLTKSASKTVTAQLKFVNKKDINQDALQGTDIILTFTATAFTCTATA